MDRRPSRDDVLMGVATLISQRSTCSRANVGAVVAREGRILVTGYNGAPAGMHHCHHSFPDDSSYTDIAGASSGCKESVHAEANCIAWAARFGIELSNSTLYTTLTPCLPCAQLIINAGVERAVCLFQYRDTMGIELLQRAGLEVDILDHDNEQETQTPS